MTSPNELRARAQGLYDQAQAVHDAEEGLIQILRSLERETERRASDRADAMAGGDTTREND